MVVDIQTNQVVAFSLTESRVHDSKEGIVLVEEAVRTSQEEGKRVKKVLADKGYDTHKMFNRLRGLGIEAVIVPRKGSKVGGSGSAREDAVRAVKKRGKKQYKQDIGYSKKNTVESFFASFKGRYGEHLMNKKIEGAKLEVWMKIWLYNRFSAMRGCR